MTKDSGATHVSEMTMNMFVKGANDKLIELSNLISSVKDASSVLDTIEGLYGLWNTKSGEESISRVEKEALELDKNKLVTELGNLVEENFSYSKTTVEVNDE